MCKFISWIETKEGNVYLTKEDLKGKRFGEYKQYNINWQADIMGHGAIRYFYGENIKGIEKEYNNFSNPDNFPKDIARDIKKGLFEGLGICEGILNEKGLKEYKKIEQPAWEEYLKIIQPAYEEYKKIEQPTWEEYEKMQQSAFWNMAKQKKYRRKEWK